MTAPARLFFVNLAVRDLKRSMAFFSRLGFEFDPRFTDENAACMVVNERASVMLLTQPFFKSFTRRELCDTAAQVEGLFGISCESRAEVDRAVKAALEAGGTVAGEVQDHGFMYGRGFYDLDGHHWEVIWMAPSAVQTS